MTGEELLERLLASYQEAFDITRPFTVNGNTYEAYAAFNVTSAKYVLVKKAELWRANCFEHTLFSCKEMLQTGDLEAFHQAILQEIEPQMVRQGTGSPPKDHMYTYLTGVFISTRGISAELEKEIRRFRFFKNYRLGLQGYAEARVLVFDLEQKKVLGNPAARELVKGYKKANLFI